MVQLSVMESTNKSTFINIATLINVMPEPTSNDLNYYFYVGDEISAITLLSLPSNIDYK